MIYQKQISRGMFRANPPLTIITTPSSKGPVEEVLSEAQVNTLIKFERRTVNKENNSWFADSDHHRITLILGLFLHLALYINSSAHDEVNDYPDSLWATYFPTEKLALSYVWFVSLIIFLTPHFASLFKSNDKLSIKDDDKKLLSKIAHVDISEMMPEQLNVMLHRIRVRQTHVLSKSSEQDKAIHQYFSNLEHQLASLPAINNRTYYAACFFDLACWMLNIAALIIDLGVTPVYQQAALPLSLVGFASLYWSRFLHAFKMQNKKLSSIFDEETMQALKNMAPELSRERVQSGLWSIRKINAKPVSDSMRLSFLRFAPTQQRLSAEENDKLSLANLNSRV